MYDPMLDELGPMIIGVLVATLLASGIWYFANQPAKQQLVIVDATDCLDCGCKRLDK